MSAAGFARALSKAPAPSRSADGMRTALQIPDLVSADAVVPVVCPLCEVQPDWLFSRSCHSVSIPNRGAVFPRSVTAPRQPC